MSSDDSLDKSLVDQCRSDANQLHELRNIVNAISMNTEVAKLKIENSQSSQEVFENLNRILNECKKFSSIVSLLRQQVDISDKTNQNSR
ncbi:hypothetical protein [Allohahella sp. A8]|jgi:signal transduction histidine kinase|uniref:hypothetical protein n=1 Tax=Allohahella sp. A8 TaxID=3141461 RepID=UPI000C0928C1|nr:hypothetical protein [Hahellaceae bacterium]|tara:strand:+ start:24687 stop:24953 length:267 start_codon:yes stop_codon:yes gene_type:complete